jgi:hypothetical protein
MVGTADGTRPAIPAPRFSRAGEAGEGESLLPVGDRPEGLAGPDAPVVRGRSARGTAKAIGWGLELPTLGRRRFRGESGSVLADVGRDPLALGGLDARHPAAKVSALWRADLADELAWRYEYESCAWGYAGLRWLVVDRGGAARAGERSSVEQPAASSVGPADVDRLRAATGQAAEVARRLGDQPARRALVGYLGTEADRLLRASSRGPVNRELLSATAEATLLAGCLTYASWPLAALAQAYFVQALALAQACRDRPLGAAVLCAMSQQAVFNGHLDEARKLVGTAISGTAGATIPGLSAHIRLLTARDHLHRNELSSCVRTLKDAVTEFDRARPGGRPGWTRWFTDADPLLFALVLGAAYLAAGLAEPARDTQLVAQRLADRTQTPCSARYVSELETSLP